MTRETDHDLLIRLDTNVQNIQETMISREDVHKIIGNKIDKHCQDKHTIKNGSVSWNNIVKILAAIMIPLGTILAPIVIYLLKQ